LLAALVLSGTATLISPHGIDGLLYPFTYAGSGNASMQYVKEWQSPDFHQLYFLLFFGTSLLLALALGLARPPLGVTEALWALLFALMALQSIRHLALYAVVTMPLLGARLQAELPWLRRSLADARRSTPGAILWKLAPCSLLLAVYLTVDPSRLQLGAEPSAATFPAGAVAYLRDHQAEGNLFNQYEWGGYLIYSLYPQRRVFIDGRADVHGDASVDRYESVERLRPNWRQVLDEHDVRLVLVRRESPLAVVLGGDAGWQELYAGEVERLFARRAA
jgi:hypothetical protein